MRKKQGRFGLRHYLRLESFLIVLEFYCIMLEFNILTRDTTKTTKLKNLANRRIVDTKIDKKPSLINYYYKMRGKLN